MIRPLLLLALAGCAVSEPTPLAEHQRPPARSMTLTVSPLVVGAEVTSV
jgi:hypothetical protein